MDYDNFPTSPAAQDMMGMVSREWYHHSYVGKWLFQVMGCEMDEAIRLFDELREQICPETATWGLPYHQHKYEVVPEPGSTLAEQRSQIINKRGSQLPMNYERMRQIAESVCQKSAEVYDGADPYTFVIKLYINDSNGKILEQQLRKAVSKIKPSHLSYEIITERPLQANTFIGMVLQQAEIINLRQVI